MLIDLLNSIDTIYIAYGVTDFRKQTSSLCSIITNTFNKSLYDNSAYIFCNKKRNSIRVLCYDKNGFILAQKTLLDTDKMKFKWPRNTDELKNISKQQLNWLLSGLELEQKNIFEEIKITLENIAS